MAVGQRADVPCSSQYKFFLDTIRRIDQVERDKTKGKRARKRVPQELQGPESGQERDDYPLVLSDELEIDVRSEFPAIEVEN